MSTVSELRQQASSLSDDEKLELVDELLAQVTLSPEEHLAVWAEEAHARHEAYLSGRVKASPLDEVMARLRAR